VSEILFILRIEVRVFPGELRDLGNRLLQVLPEENVTAIRKSSKKRWVFGIDAVAESGKFKVIDNPGLKKAAQTVTFKPLRAR
jgi:hypothetical protein